MPTPSVIARRAVPATLTLALLGLTGCGSREPATELPPSASASAPAPAPAPKTGTRLAKVWRPSHSSGSLDSASGGLPPR